MKTPKLIRADRNGRATTAAHDAQQSHTDSGEPKADSANADGTLAARVGENNVDNNGDNVDHEEGEWPEEDDQPEDFPDVGFPMEPPSYPSPPEFEYRYRAGARSTPQRRRVDFNRAIVLRPCRRDPVTGRIPQQEYDAREDAEMMASLGYVLLL